MIKTREVAEWLKAHAWKACIWQHIEGSNPFLSAKYLYYKNFSIFYSEWTIQLGILKIEIS